MSALRSVTLYCSSSRSLDPHFSVAARATGELLARRGITLVYGGGGLGLMGEAARACKAAGGRVEGIITRKFLDLEQGWLGCDELVVVDTMRERWAIKAFNKLPRLQELCAHLEVKFEDSCAHDAIYDAQALAKCMKAAHERGLTWTAKKRRAPTHHTWFV